jgi:hypothetical protein
MPWQINFPEKTCQKLARNDPLPSNIVLDSYEELI